MSSTLIARQPNIAPRLPKRPTVRVALVLRYPYKVFYRVQGEGVEILHIRHTARRPLDRGKWVKDAVMLLSA